MSAEKRRERLRREFEQLPPFDRRRITERAFRAGLPVEWYLDTLEGVSFRFGLALKRLGWEFVPNRYRPEEYRT